VSGPLLFRATTRCGRRGEDVSERLRLRYAVARNLRLFIPKYKSADERSVFVRALESTRTERAVEPLPGGSQPFNIEAKQYPWWDEQRVIAVAVPARRPAKTDPRSDA
jgi:hypothetical protein